MSKPILTMEVRLEHDVVLARQRARQIAGLLGFEPQDQTRIATAVSEIARNAFQYAGGGKVEFLISGDKTQMLEARVTDTGVGIPNLSSILGGSYVSQTGMGLGLIGAKRLMDNFDIATGPRGTIVIVGKHLPAGSPPISRAQMGRITQDIAILKGDDPFAEIQRQNQELLATMGELEKRQQELSELNRELEDTNRGVVALYAELDQRADFLRRVSESKTRFFSSMTHEFRTPLNSIISLSRMLADKLDGPLTPEQEKQVGFIRRAAADLSHLVDELLDIAKVEAGKVTVRPDTFNLAELFGSLRGTLRPLLAQNSAVNLVFEDPADIPPLYTDEAKLTQILRNFVSNALKYTERGEVRISARMEDPEHVLISVADTGIGIAPENQARIFEEFEQVEGAHQLRTKGTGLGLPLAKSLADLLGGSVRLESAFGLGSTFSVLLPIAFGKPAELLPVFRGNGSGKKILVVDDDEASRYVLKTLLAEEQFQIVEAKGGFEGIRQAIATRPNAIVLDLGLPDLDGREVLKELKHNADTLNIPVIINTSRPLPNHEKEELTAMAVGILSKNDPDPKAARRTLFSLLTAAGAMD
jgi:signal transduction histidine kinase/CheY-like chemotaxis protein